MGGWRRQLAVRLGPAGRRGVDPRDTPGGRPRHQLDRYGSGVRSRPLRGGRWTCCRGTPLLEASLRLHEMQPRVERGARRHSQSETGLHPTGGRGQPRTAGHANRSLPDALAEVACEPGRVRSGPLRGGVGHDGRLAARGKGAAHRRIELQRRAARSVRSHRPDRQPAAALFIAAAEHRGKHPPLVRIAPCRGDRACSRAA
jgi:hypothetical protein